MKKTVVFDMTNTIFRTKKKIGGKSGQSKATQDAQEKSRLSQNVEAMPYAIETFLDFYEQGYKIVIISAAGIQRNRQILQFLLEEYGITQDKSQEIFKQIDILTTQFFGSKYDSDAWKQAMEPYQNIEYIFEDGESKLDAAGQAAQELGHDPELYSSIADFAG